MSEPTLRQACRVVLAAGYTPVNTENYQRLRAWLDETNGWPPKDYAAPSPPLEEAEA